MLAFTLVRRHPGHEKALRQQREGSGPTLERERLGAHQPLRPVSCWSGLRIRAARRSVNIVVLVKVDEHLCPGWIARSSGGCRPLPEDSPEECLTLPLA